MASLAHTLYSFSSNSRNRMIVFVALLAIALLVSAAWFNEGFQFRSVELKFSDNSPQGMRIVPASCPSSPHYSGECSTDCAFAGGCPSSCSNGLDIAQYPSCTCPAGQTQNGSICVPVGGVDSCTDTYYCSGSDLWVSNSCTGNSFVQACAYGCSSGACNAPPPSQGNISATPSLVRAGDTTQISWSTQYTSSCTVTENNPDINDSWTGTSGTTTSSALAQQTIYTLRCTGIDGNTFTDTATVNIVPVFDEPTLH